MDRRRRRLRLEILEARSLLSGLSYSLTTDASTYQVGQTIQLTFTETNTSTQPVMVAVAPTDFTVSQGAYAIWQSDPNNENQPPTSETLQPGQSLTQSASWDGTTPNLFDDAPASPINYWGTFVVSNPNAPQGLTASFQITDPISISLTPDQSVYQMGQPVQVTFARTNTSDQPITYEPGGPDEFTISHDGTPLYLIAYPTILIGPVTLQAGQAQTAHAGVEWPRYAEPRRLHGRFRRRLRAGK